MLWEVEIRPKAGLIDYEGQRILAESRELGSQTIDYVKTAKSFLIETSLPEADVRRIAGSLLVDVVVEDCDLRTLPSPQATANGHRLLNVLLKPGVTDNVARSARNAMTELGVTTEAVSTCRKYWINSSADEADIKRISTKLLANDAIEHVLEGPLQLESITLGSPYQFELTHIAIREMDDAALEVLSKEGQLYLSLTEMQTIRDYFISLDRDPTDVELETVAQTWSEHCSHKTLAGRIHYKDESRDIQFDNMLKETVLCRHDENS
jgi:phosphoribosylformylglycinamidine (FGAM) synthase PurS component